MAMDQPTPKQIRTVYTDPIRNKWGMGLTQVRTAMENGIALTILRNPHSVADLAAVLEWLVRKRGVAIDPATGQEMH